jgi:hypothetical protein
MIEIINFIEIFFYIDFQNALFVPRGNNGLVTILIPIFGK